MDPFKQSHFLIFDGGDDIGDGVMVDVLACLETSGDGIYGEEDSVA